jgi:hypothetical protein
VTSQALTRTAALRLGPLGTLDLPGLGAWLLSFALVVVVGFSGGGYDVVFRGEVGIAVWWIVLVGAAFGLVGLPGTRLAQGGLGLAALLVGWTVLSLGWTESLDRTWSEVARVLSYAGVLVLALAVLRAAPARLVVAGAACGVAVVALVAVLSRLEPGLVAPSPADEFFPQSRGRLAYPLEYFNALACLMAMGAVLLLAVAASARTIVGRALAAAAVPVCGLAIFLADSRGGIGMIAVGVLVLLALTPDRLPKLALLAVTGAGTALLVAAADGRDALQQALPGALAEQQGQELIALLLVVCVGVGLLAAAVGLLDLHQARPGWAVVGRRAAGAATAVTVALAAVAFLVAGGPGFVGDRWEEFKTPSPASVRDGDNAIARITNFNGEGRYEYWKLALHQDRLRGTGSGTFEFLWSRDGTPEGGSFVRDAHSLWFETLAELGLVGLALIAGLLLGTGLLGGAWRALRERDPEHRTALAGAVAGLAAFCAGATIEWAWEMPVLAMLALILLACAAAGHADPPLRLRATPVRAPRLPARMGLAAVALVAVAAIALPTAGAARLRASQADVRAGDLTAALEQARSAAALQPYAAAPPLQQALVLERAGALQPALAAARAATRDEPTNFRPWLVRSRLATRTGDPADALASFRRARSLNPRSPLFRR